MPIPPPPTTFTCPVCTWKKTRLPLSDALVAGRDFFSHCPRCQHQPLEQRPASRAEIMRTRLNHFLKQHPL
ncbi:MAG: hypothetical protein GAK43_01304 [Stenotrophomonas maltophilia]|nr:MAG: hypothetical protein GAK43_01304 [Stenotrophomonas maltophilia]